MYMNYENSMKIIPNTNLENILWLKKRESTVWLSLTSEKNSSHGLFLYDVVTSNDSPE